MVLEGIIRNGEATTVTREFYQHVNPFISGVGFVSQSRWQILTIALTWQTLSDELNNSERSEPRLRISANGQSTSRCLLAEET